MVVRSKRSNPKSGQRRISRIQRSYECLMISYVTTDSLFRRGLLHNAKQGKRARQLTLLQTPPRATSRAEKRREKKKGCGKGGQVCFHSHSTFLCCGITNWNEGQPPLKRTPDICTPPCFHFIFSTPPNQTSQPICELVPIPKKKPCASLPPPSTQ